MLTGVRTPAVADDPVAASGSTGSQESPDTAPWFLACGSLLPGLSADFYARAGRLARDRGARFVPDCDGAALAAAAEEADLLVPNEMEAERLAGLTVRDPVTAAAAGRKLLRRGPRRVVVTLGAKGAVAVDDAGAWWARPAPSSLDAGRLAGLVQALDRAVSGEAALADAVAAGTATLLSRGSALVRRADFEEAREWVRVERLPDRL